MTTHLLFLALYLAGGLNSQPTPVQSPDAVRVSGICFDATTAVYLPVEAFTMSGSTKIKLGQSDSEGKFDFLLPLSATTVSFTCRDYQTVTLPVTFVNNPGNGAKFRFGLIMGKRDSVAVRQTHQLIINNNLPDTTDVNYHIEPTGSNAGLPIVTTAHGNRVAPGGSFTVKKGRKWPLIVFEGARPGPYRLAASMANGRVLVDKAFTVKEGLTFMEVKADEPSQPASMSNARESSRDKSGSLIPKTVYFDQSHYELSPATKASLDSVARMLLTQQQVVAHITGYTDNVGEQNLNVTLSEYRAKMVANYLKQKGIREAQLLIDWKGGDVSNGLGDSEAVKAKNRRVVIQFNPK